MREKLWPNAVPGIPENEQPTLEPFLLPRASSPRTAIIVCPGGGYSMVCDSYEGVDVARYFNEHGIAAFVLRYRVGKWARHPAPLQDAERAMRMVRSRAQEYGVDPQRIGILGFSAGGHLTASLATHFSVGEPKASDPIERLSSRPDFAVPVYPVISMFPPHGHAGSRQNLLGSDPDPKLLESFSIERSVPENAPPMFLVHTDEDAGVVPENSVELYLALRRKKISAELHIFEKGAHGLGLGGGAKGNPGTRGMHQWPELCLNWLRERGMLQ